MRNKNPWIHYGILTFIYVIGAMTLVTHTVLHSLLHGGGDIVYASRECGKVATLHMIVIQHNAFVPSKIIVHRCDIVTFKNEDKNVLYQPALGEHPHHIVYAGFTEKVLGYNQENTFIAHSKGIFLVHDHLKDETEGTIVVQ